MREPNCACGGEMLPFMKDGQIAHLQLDAKQQLPPLAMFICTTCGRCRFVSFHIRAGKKEEIARDEIPSEMKKDLGLA